MAYSERIKNFDKIRDYMRDFYIYGFKVRGDFSAKSARTYDDEKRRIESYLGRYVRWESGRRGKRVYISLDTAHMDVNPLYAAWKSKSFTDNDITLHFAVLSALKGSAMTAAALADAVSAALGRVYDTQTVRLKAEEYVREGLLEKERRGKAHYYALSGHTLSALPVDTDALLDAVRFFQEAAPFGVVGSAILDSRDAVNDIFRFKHHYIVHTLEDGVLLTLLRAIRERRRVAFMQQSSKSGEFIAQVCVPLQAFVSVQSGRRYLCAYVERAARFHCFRLDYIKHVTLGEGVDGFDALRAQLEVAKPYVWGVSFGGPPYKRMLRMTLRVDGEKERYVLDRLRREGRGGEITRVDKDIFLYSREVYDVTEMMAWVKSFTGRIVSLESDDAEAAGYFYRDMERMAAMYAEEGGR